MSKYAIFTAVALILTAPAYAQDTGTGTPPAGQNAQARQEHRAEMKKHSDDARAQRDERRKAIRQKREENRKARAEKRKDHQEQWKGRHSGTAQPSGTPAPAASPAQ